MANKRDREPTWKPDSDAAAELDALNSDLRNQPRSANSIRQIIEADIESKAKKRRRSEPSTSSGVKRDP
jgi:hypothetical protein